jgi:hypothetical protein
MPVANYNRKILDLKRWAVMPTPAPAATLAGSLIISSRLNQQRQLYLTSNTTAWLYYPFEDGWVQIPSPALAGTFGAGTCGTCSAIGPTGTATGGTTTTVITGLNLQRSLAGYQIEITSGPGAGEIRTIARNTFGAAATITVTSAFGAAITASSTFRLMTPRWYVLNAGTLAAGSFRMYCFALNTWTTLANTGLPATWGTDGKMIATPSFGDNGVDVNFATGTATAGAATTLTRGTANWAVNQWANFQVRIHSGTGAGQIRTIASNTATVLTVSAAWTTNPDATSVYHIEGNDDFLYILGNNAVALYRYSISGNTTTTLAPVAARAAAPGVGASGHWVFDVPASIDADWSAENAIINGRRIYSFRAGGGAVLDYYDIAANTWVSGVIYSPLTETFTTGSKYVYAGGYIYMTKEATGRWFRFSPAEGSMVGWGTNIYPQGAAVAGDTAFDTVEPETGIRFINMVLNTSTIHMRCMVV